MKMAETDMADTFAADAVGTGNSIDGYGRRAATALLLAL
jgi:hypothetical protein